MIERTIPKLIERLKGVRDGTYDNKPYYGIIMEEDSNDWQYLYQGLFIGNLATDWSQRWRVYLGFKCELPSHEDLQSIRVLVFPGSARAVYDESNLFVPEVSAFIRKVMSDHPKIKLFGSCFGHQIFGHALGGRTE